VHLLNPVAVVVVHIERTLDLSGGPPGPEAITAVHDPPTFHHRDVDWGREAGISSQCWKAELATASAIASMADWIGAGEQLPPLAPYHLNFKHPSAGFYEVTSLYAVPAYEAIRSAIEAHLPEDAPVIDRRQFAVYAEIKAAVTMRLLFALDVDLTDFADDALDVLNALDLRDTVVAAGPDR
jgi:hypothetical protein